MHLPSTKSVCLWLLMALLTGCSTDKDELMPPGTGTMLDHWNGATVSDSSSSSRLLMDARQQLRRPLHDTDTQLASYTRTAQNEIYSQFKRLPNPDLVLYVFPHLTGKDPAPIPGYSTVFPFYQRVQYAMPGERIEDY
ncbi:TIGR03751 family conjugal transfer lipoprotein [Pseudomonas sp. LJDD11]|uniref:TIGR03751 family conjugal transfer lipoprotein n=1 Tax=unclassified Pseudomonas TaxID=196821 RepID=UPI0020986189|nr:MULTISPECIES: TIGR03751 family conjugal transfer lipoprotein [unclassified Pseudomonas]MCO8163885.1 TIGR03751 family conjugal transfer lipoprotein [Pseudomonas sp. 21LCFQ010]MCQ9422317.1 TIGR03751 family conjugal transfer lipoprotein [Pseudomonas sp. LJDD11]